MLIVVGAAMRARNRSRLKYHMIDDLAEIPRPQVTPPLTERFLYLFLEEIW